LKGEFGPPGAGESSFQRAIDIAQAQGSRALEIRAVISLAELYRRTGRAARIPSLFGPVLPALTGADRSDREQALSLLEPS
jgi:adenylate cyclase